MLLVKEYNIGLKVSKGACLRDGIRSNPTKAEAF